jgi:hypothetical protein
MSGGPGDASNRLLDAAGDVPDGETGPGSASGELPDASGGPGDASNRPLDAVGEAPDGETSRVPRPARRRM